MRSFIKWAGGKYQVLPQIKSVLPKGKRLIEPFVGSGTVFLNMDYPHYLLGEINGDLINVYHHLIQEGPDFIDYCKLFFIPENNTKTCFYAQRELFNTTQDKRLKAALFIYLNRHAFNGLCRFNSKGKFNVPFGRYVKPFVPEEAMLNFFHKVKQAEIVEQDFNDTMDQAKKGDVVYCDPPYVPLSETAFFTAYNRHRFTEQQQIQLADKAKALAARGIPVVISNHDVPLTRELYEGASCISFPVQRQISQKGSARKPVFELLALFE